jgi:hypothetical protein
MRGYHMPEQEPPSGRATVTQVYDIVDRLRTEIREDIKCLSDEQKNGFSDLLVRLDTMVKGLREDFVSKDAFKPVKDAVADMQKQMKWAAGIIITSFLGLIVYLFQSHIR